MLSTEAIAPVEPFRLERSVYHRLADLGTFVGRRVQLIRGTVIDMSPMGTSHAAALMELTMALAARCSPGVKLRVQLPLAADDDSEPEPDFALIQSPVESTGDHPSTALLVIEVADTSLRLDLGPKAALYAQCRVPEYWVIDLAAGSTVVHRTLRHGRYESVRRAPWSRILTSSALPQLGLRLDEFLKRG